MDHINIQINSRQLKLISWLMLPHLSKLFQVCFSNSSTLTVATLKNLFSWHRPAIDFFMSYSTLSNILIFRRSTIAGTWQIFWVGEKCLHFQWSFPCASSLQEEKNLPTTPKSIKRTMCRLLVTHLLILKSDLGCNSGKYDLSSWQAMNHKLSSV